MQGIKCKICSGITNQFSILDCDHVICTQCIYGQLKSATSKQSLLKCPCGKITIFNSDISPLQASKPAHQNHKSRLIENKSTPYLSGCSSPLRQSKQIPKLTRITRTSTAPLINSIFQPKLSSDNYHKQSQLKSQLQFIDILFRKSLDETQRLCTRIIDNLKRRYQNMINNVKLFWLQEIVGLDPPPLVNLAKLIQRKYHKILGHKIQNINNNLLQVLSTLKMIQPFKKHNLKNSRLQQQQKQNNYINLSQSRKRNNKTLEDISTKSWLNRQITSYGPLKKGIRRQIKYKY